MTAHAHGATGTAAGVETSPANLTSLLHLGASFTNVPGGTASWSFDGNTNYKATSGSVGIVLTQADAVISVSGYTGVYDGTAHGATGTAAGVETSPANLTSLLHLGASFTNVPGGTASWSFDGNTNYKATSGSVGIVLTQADAVISVSGYTGVYDGTCARGDGDGGGGRDEPGGSDEPAAPGGQLHERARRHGELELRREHELQGDQRQRGHRRSGRRRRRWW